MRKRKELDVINSAHRFLGEFKNQELEAYNVAPQMFNEFKGEGGPEVCFLKRFISVINSIILTRTSLT